MYPDQARQVSEWIQEILKLRVAIQRTNLCTNVTIELGGQQVIKSIAEWIHRRRDLANLERDAWKGLTDRNLREHNMQAAPGGPVTEIRVRRYYQPAERDVKIALYNSEPSVIDGALEVANATTDLLEG